jgi:hypothetical protein
MVTYEQGFNLVYFPTDKKSNADSTYRTDPILAVPK